MIYSYLKHDLFIGESPIINLDIDIALSQVYGQLVMQHPVFELINVIVKLSCIIVFIYKYMYSTSIA